MHGNRVSSGVTLPLGSLALQDLSHKSLKRAERIVSNDLSDVAQLKAGQGRTFYAVGGTWRALARIHIVQSGYPLRVMHGYSSYRPPTRWISRGACAGSRRPTCSPISKSSPMHGVRC